MTPNMEQWQAAQDSPEVPVNSNFFGLQHQAVYSMDPTSTTGLTWGYRGERWGGFAITAGTLTLTASVANYLVVAIATGVMSGSTSNTNWNKTTDYVRVYQITPGASTVSIANVQDHRAGPGGVHGGTGGGEGGGSSTSIPQNSQSAAYTLLIGDAGKHIFHPSADTTARIWTIPANASVAFPIGTVVSFVNQNAAGVITIAITTDTMRLAGTGATGSRTLAANGIATALKVTATEWLISGTGLT